MITIEVMNVDDRELDIIADIMMQPSEIEAAGVLLSNPAFIRSPDTSPQ